MDAPMSTSSSSASSDGSFLLVSPALGPHQHSDSGSSNGSGNCSADEGADGGPSPLLRSPLLHSGGAGAAYHPYSSDEDGDGDGHSDGDGEAELARSPISDTAIAVADGDENLSATDDPLDLSSPLPLSDARDDDFLPSLLRRAPPPLPRTPPQSSFAASLGRRKQPQLHISRSAGIPYRQRQQPPRSRSLLSVSLAEELGAARQLFGSRDPPGSPGSSPVPPRPVKVPPRRSSCELFVSDGNSSSSFMSEASSYDVSDFATMRSPNAVTPRDHARLKEFTALAIDQRDAKLARQRVEIQKLTRDLKDLREEWRAANEYVRESDDKLAAANQQLSAMRRRLKKAEGGATVLEERVAWYTNEVKRLVDELEEAKTERRKAFSEKMGLYHDVEHAKKELTQTQQQLRSREVEVRKSAERVTREIEPLAQQNRDLQLKAEETERESYELRETSASLRIELCRRDEHIAVLRSENSGLRDHLQRATSSRGRRRHHADSDRSAAAGGGKGGLHARHREIGCMASVDSLSSSSGSSSDPEGDDTAAAAISGGTASTLFTAAQSSPLHATSQSGNNFLSPMAAASGGGGGLRQRRQGQRRQQRQGRDSMLSTPALSPLQLVSVGTSPLQMMSSPLQMVSVGTSPLRSLRSPPSAARSLLQELNSVCMDSLGGMSTSLEVSRPTHAISTQTERRLPTLSELGILAVAVVFSGAYDHGAQLYAQGAYVCEQLFGRCRRRRKIRVQFTHLLPSPSR